MKRQSSLPFAAMILSVLLPYAVIEVFPLISSAYQQWLFPFWYYVHDYDFGVFRFLFQFSGRELPIVGLGAIWFVLGLSTSILLRELCLGQIQLRLVIILLLVALVSQVSMTILVLSQVYGDMLNYMIPLPLHTIAVLLIAAIAPERNEE